jgi:hypothetical protein
MTNTKRDCSSENSMNESEEEFDSESDDDDARCLQCHKLWSRSAGSGDWVKCRGCKPNVPAIRKNNFSV